MLRWKLTPVKRTKILREQKSGSTCYGWFVEFLVSITWLYYWSDKLHYYEKLHNWLEKYNDVTQTSSLVMKREAGLEKTKGYPLQATLIMSDWIVSKKLTTHTVYCKVYSIDYVDWQPANYYWFNPVVNSTIMCYKRGQVSKRPRKAVRERSSQLVSFEYAGPHAEENCEICGFSQNWS